MCLPLYKRNKIVYNSITKKLYAVKCRKACLQLYANLPLLQFEFKEAEELKSPVFYDNIQNMGPDIDFDAKMLYSSEGVKRFETEPKMSITGL